MELLDRVRWTNEDPAIYVNIYYEYQRSGADMQYRIKLAVEPITGYSYYGYSIYSTISMDGSEKVSTTLKGNSPSQWGSNIEWTTDWYTISNKTTGTTSLAVRINSNDGVRDATYNYNMYVAPAYTTVSKWSASSKAETSITMSWQTADTCSQIKYKVDSGSYTTANVNSNSGTITFNNLSAGQNHTLYFIPKRKDSNLWGDGSADNPKTKTEKTYAYPYCSSTNANFTIGNNVTLNIANPLNRRVEIQMWSYAGSTFINSTRLSTNVNGNYTFPASNYNSQLYASIPNAKTSQYSIDVWYGNHKEARNAGTYSINENDNKPIFNDFTYADINTTTTALTGNNQIIVQGYSNVQATISVANKATAQNYATMDHYDLIITGNNTNRANYSASSNVSITTNGANSGSIKVSAVDSRNLAKEVSKTATVKDYTNIQKGNINIVRTVNVGAECTLSYDGTLWGKSFGSITNTAKSARYRYKKTTDSDWSGWNGTTTITPTTSGNNYSYNHTIAGDLGNTGFSVEYSFNIEVEVFDELSSVVFTFVLGTGIPHIAIDDNGIAIKQPYDTNDDSVLQVNGKTKLKGNTSITGNGSIGGTLTIGSFTKNTTDTWMPVIRSGELQYTLRKFATSKTHTNYNTDQDYLPTMSFISYWNGAYNSSNASNLTYAHQGTIQCKPTNLYNSSSGTTGTINLSQTSANFTYLTIFYKKKNSYTNADTYHSVDVYSPNGKKVSLIWASVEASNVNQIVTSTKTISGTSITHNYGGYMNIYTNGGVTASTSNNEIYIVRVDGWK